MKICLMKSETLEQEVGCYIMLNKFFLEICNSDYKGVGVDHQLRS